MYRTNDPVADAERHIYEQDKRLERLPICCECGEHIQSEWLYDINGDLYCEDCMKNCRMAVERYEQ
jgi:formylmethanofuran dehydrogenase subunit E